MKFTCLFDSVCSPFIPLLAVIVRLFKFDIQGILICIVKKWSKTYTSRWSASQYFQRTASVLHAGECFWRIKQFASVIAKPIAHLINLTIRSGEIPLEWKEAKVTPIFKLGKRNEENNYRPIPVLPLISKIMERSIQVQLRIMSYPYINQGSARITPLKLLLSMLLTIYCNIWISSKWQVQCL
jgi:hypothetical protein